MNNTKTARRLLLVLIPVLLLIAAAAVWLLTRPDDSPEAEAAATAILTKIYTATQQDYEDLTAAISQSQSSDQPLLDYVHKAYPGFTNEGYSTFLQNRVALRAAQIAHDGKFDVVAASVTLTPMDAERGSKRYSYTVQIQASEDPSKTFTQSGNLKLIEENDLWTVDGII